jgi:hypothetical protein
MDSIDMVHPKFGVLVVKTVTIDSEIFESWRMQTVISFLIVHEGVDKDCGCAPVPSAGDSQQ